MSRLRALAESDLETTLEGEWSDEIRLTAPDGSQFVALGQYLRGITRKDIETGERVVIATPVVTLRRSTLERVPVAGESWFVETPDGPFVFSPVRPPENSSLGFIRLYLQAAEQSEPEEPEA